MLIEYFISILELTSLTVFAMMLHSLRRILGTIPLYLVVGSFFVLGQVVLLPGFAIHFQDPSRVGSLVYGLSLLPVLLLFLIVYESEGSQEAQRVVLGLVVLTLITFYIIQLFLSQYNLAGGDQADALGLSAYVNFKMQRQLLGMTLLHLFLFLLLPTFYQLLRNYNLPIMLCFFLPIVFFLTASNQFLQLFKIDSVSHPLLIWLGRFLAVFWVCFLANVYLLLGKMLRLERRMPLGFITTLFDHIKSASQMRQSVLEWAGRYETVLENSGELIFLLNEKGDVVNANTAAVEILGRSLSKPGFNLISLITDGEHTAFDWANAWQKLVAGDVNKRISTYMDMLLHLPSDKILHVDFNLSQARVNENVMALLIAHDTTMQFERQQERQQLEEQLVHAQRMEAIGLLAGGVAHDFNNLLHTIQANVEMLSRQSMPIPAQAMLASIDDASKRATDLTSQLLGFARKGKFLEEILDLGTIIQQSVNFFQTTSRSIVTKAIIEPTPLLVKGDPVQLQQVMLNLLINAKDALADKHASKNVTIRVETARADMAEWKISPMRGHRATDYVFITVRDNGSGMSPQVRDRIFEPFFTTKATGKGTGMGLAMVYGCINNHRGWINVQSTPGEGTTFVIILPKAGEMPKL